MANITLKRFNGTLWEEMKVASEWSIVEGKPATFPPSGHGHNASDITSGEFNRLRVREIVSKDTRNTEDDPDSSLAGARFDFKSTTASGLVDGGSYNGIMTYRPYGNSSADFSGGPSHQLGFSGGGNLHHRTGDGSGWNTWKKIAYTDDSIPLSKIVTGRTSTDILIETPEGGIGAIPQSTFAPASHNHSATHITSGTLTVPRGGTGRSTLNAYRLLAGGTTTTGNVQSVVAGTSGQLLKSNGLSALPTFTDIKKINGQSILGTGDITVTASGDFGENPIYIGDGYNQPKFRMSSSGNGNLEIASLDGTTVLSNLSIPYGKDGTVATMSDLPTDTMKLIRGRSNNSALTSALNGDNVGIIALDEYVTWGDTLFIEVLGKTGSASYTPKIVPVTLRTNSSSPNSTTEYYTASFSTFNGTNFNIYSFTVSAVGSELYFGSKKLLTGSFSGTTINWYTNTYTLYVGRVWKV